MSELFPLYLAVFAAIVLADMLYYSIKLAALGIKNHLDKKKESDLIAQSETARVRAIR